MTLARVDADALDAFRLALSEHVGIELTVSQCVRWLVNNAAIHTKKGPKRDGTRSQEGTPSQVGLGAAWRNLGKR